MALVGETSWVTAILEAGRRSLDDDGSVHQIRYDQRGAVTDIARLNRQNDDITQ